MEKKIIESKEDTDEISLKDLFLMVVEWYRYLLSKWLLIVVLGIVGGALGFTYAKLKKPVYTAVTTFVLEEGDKSGGLGQYAGLASMVGVDIGGGGGGIFQGDNILQLYKSRIMIVKTLLTKVKYDGKEELLIDRYIDFNKLREKWSKNDELKNIQFKAPDSGSMYFTRLQDSIIGTIVKEIDLKYLNVAKPDKKLSIIRVEVNANDEFFAKTFNDQIVQNVNDFYVQTKTKKSLQNISILQHKTDSVRSVMNGAIYAAAAVSDATPNLNLTRQVQRIAPAQRSQFNAETNKAMLSEFVKTLEMSKISLNKESPLIQVIDNPIYPLDKVKFSKLKGIIIGGFLAGFLTCLFLICRRLLKMILV